MTVIDNAIYVDGRRVATPRSLDETFDALEQYGGFAWIGLYRPDAHELGLVAAEFGLHELAVEDALGGHQRAKLEQYGDTLFAVLRPARYRANGRGICTRSAVQSHIWSAAPSIRTSKSSGFSTPRVRSRPMGLASP